MRSLRSHLGYDRSFVVTKETDMRKLTFVVGAGVGFVLGSRAGKGPYEQLEARVRGVANRPDVQKTVGDLTSTAKDQVSSATEKVTDKIPGSGDPLDDTAVVTRNDIPQGI
jgi:hypothetical protein